jgi:hypothetical protein
VLRIESDLLLISLDCSTLTTSGFRNNGLSRHRTDLQASTSGVDGGLSSDSFHIQEMLVMEDATKSGHWVIVV